MPSSPLPWIAVTPNAPYFVDEAALTQDAARRHLADGGAGGGMRWPNRHPHVLTPGMRRAQRAMADFLPLIDWQRFRRKPVQASVTGYHAIGCGEDEQALIWMVRRGGRSTDGRIDAGVAPVDRTMAVPLSPGHYRVVEWDTRLGRAIGTTTVDAVAGECVVTLRALAGDRAVAISRL